MEMDTNEELRRKVEVYFDKHIPIHIITNKDSWINGYIVEVSSDFFIVDDDLVGRKGRPRQRRERLEHASNRGADYGVSGKYVLFFKVFMR